MARSALLPRFEGPVLSHPGRAFDAWYHCQLPGRSSAEPGHPATLAELTRIIKDGRITVDDISRSVTRISLRHLDGKREILTITEAAVPVDD